MMDMIYTQYPLFLLFPILLVLWQIVTMCIKKKLPGKAVLEWIFTGISAIGHAAAIVLILLNGGKMEDVLVLVLLTGFVTLLLCEKPEAKSKETEDGNK